MLGEFLETYTSCSKSFNHEDLVQAKQAKPQLFKDRFSQKESEMLLVEWHWPVDVVLISGPRSAVESKLIEFEKCLCISDRR